jgi:O-antigen/teichoic acid export membrane protein
MLRDRAGRAVRRTGISSVIVAGLQLTQAIVLARLLAPDEFGVVSLLLLAVSFGQSFADMGTSNAIIQRRETAAEQLSSLFWLNIAAGLTLLGLVALGAPAAASFFAEPRLQTPLLLAALIFPVTAAGQLHFALMQRELRFGYLVVVDVTSVSAGTIVTVATVLGGQGILAVVWGQLVTACVRALLLLAGGARDFLPSLRFRRADLSAYISFGLYQLGERVLGYFTWNADKILIGRLLGTQALGYYEIAYQLVIRPVSVLNPVVTRVAFPIFARIQNDNARLRQGYLEVIRVLAFVGMPLYLGMSAAAEPLVRALFGPGWEPAAAVLQVLALLGLFYTLGNPLGSLLLAKGRADVGFWLHVAALIVYVFAVFIGASWGISGVAVALVISSAFILFPLEVPIRRWLVGMRLGEYVNAFGPFLGMALAASVVVRVFDEIFSLGSPTGHLVLLVAIGAAVYLVGATVFFRPFLRSVRMTLAGGS